MILGTTHFLINWLKPVLTGTACDKCESSEKSFISPRCSSRGGTAGEFNGFTRVCERTASMCVSGELSRRMSATAAAAAAGWGSADFISLFSHFAFYFLLSGLFFCRFFLCVVVWRCVPVGMSERTRCPLRLLWEEAGQHCTGDRTACLPLLLPLGWWVTMMWRDLCPPSLLFFRPSVCVPPPSVGGNRAVPVLGAALQKPFREYLEAQKAKLHHLAGEGVPTVSTGASVPEFLFNHVCAAKFRWRPLQTVNNFQHHLNWASWS